MLFQHKAYIDSEQVNDTPPHPYPIFSFLCSTVIITSQKKLSYESITCCEYAVYIFRFCFLECYLFIYWIDKIKIYVGIRTYNVFRVI